MPGVPPPSASLSPVRSLSSSDITEEQNPTSEPSCPAHTSRASNESLPPQQQQQQHGRDALAGGHAPSSSMQREKRESDASDSSWLSTDDPKDAERFSEVCTQYTSLYPVRTQLTRIMIKVRAPGTSLGATPHRTPSWYPAIREWPPLLLPLSPGPPPALHPFQRPSRTPSDPSDHSPSLIYTLPTPSDPRP